VFSGVIAEYDICRMVDVSKLWHDAFNVPNQYRINPFSFGDGKPE
jgi:hypothetical protein